MSCCARQAGLWLSLLLSLALCSAAAAGGEAPKSGRQVEKWPNGQTKVEAWYEAGVLQGAYTEYYENGRTKLRASYQKGQLHGQLVEYGPDGVTVVRDEIHFNGELFYPRSPAQINEALAKIYAAAAAVPPGPVFLEAPSTKGEFKAGKLSPAALQAGLLRLKAYRYLAGVPYEDVALSDKYNDEAQHAAVLLGVLGKLEHTPAKPAGVPDDFFKTAYQGTSHSNLAQGRGNLPGSVDMWMFDSDPANIDRLGHRRWCLNPTMLNTGFGLNGVFAALWALDTARKPAPDFDYLPYPVKGYQPMAYFGGDWAWSVSFNPAKYAKLDKAQIKVNLWPLDGQLARATKPLELNYLSTETGGFGVPLCLIFRPKVLPMGPGARYQVEVQGVKLKDGADAKVQYVVEFFR
jgi:hypothetical protein